MNGHRHIHETFNPTAKQPDIIHVKAMPYPYRTWLFHPKIPNSLSYPNLTAHINMVNTPITARQHSNESYALKGFNFMKQSVVHFMPIRTKTVTFHTSKFSLNIHYSIKINYNST
jgi:hypothetical protein